MASIEINIIDKNGDFGSIHSTKEIGYSTFSTRVEMALEKKYLPIHISKYGHKSRCFEAPEFKNGDCEFPYLQEIWDLIENKKLTTNDRIVLGFIFHRAFVFKKDKQKLVSALKEFDTNHNIKTSCGRIAEIIENDSDGLAYHQSSSSGDDVFGSYYDEDLEEDVIYNINNKSAHFDLFEYIKEIDYSFS